MPCGGGVEEEEERAEAGETTPALERAGTHLAGLLSSSGGGRM
jgi:hypothetical protein